MVDPSVLVTRAKNGDLRSYGTVVSRFQDMAVGYAYSILGDYHSAQDVAQEAFVRAYLDLSALREPAAFAVWFRKIVFKYCDRFVRRKRVETVPLEYVSNLASDGPDPAEAVETREMRDDVLRALQTLPESERTVTALFYINGYSQDEIGEFLEIPAKTVKSRLYTARSKLRGRMIDMVKEHLHAGRPSKDDRFTVEVIEDLEKLSDQQIQTLLHCVNPAHLALALTGTSEQVRRRIYSNASEYVEAFIKEAMSFAGSVPASEIEGERARTVERAQQLVGTEMEAEMSEESSVRMGALRSRLEGKAFSDLGFDEIGEVFTNMAEIAIREGILRLDIADLPNEELFRLGLHLVVDGREPEEIQAILDTRAEVLMRHQETRYRIIIEGVASIHPGKPPGYVGMELRNLYESGQRPDARSEEDSETGFSVRELKTRLRATPFSRLALDEMTELIIGMAIVAQKEGVESLAGLIGLIDEELLTEGLRMAAEGQVGKETFPHLAPHIIRRMLQIRKGALLQQQKTRYLMITEGMRSLQCGDHPRIIEQKMRSFYDNS